VPQRLELVVGARRFLRVDRVEALAPLHAQRERAQRGDAVRDRRLRGARQRRAGALERDERELERLREVRDQREAAGAVDAAHRVRSADHRLRRRRARVELQQRLLVVERREVLVGLVDEHAVQRARELDVADVDVVGLRARGVRVVGDELERRRPDRSRRVFRAVGVDHLDRDRRGRPAEFGQLEHAGIGGERERRGLGRARRLGLARGGRLV
jgi:hypothetical protein